MTAADFNRAKKQAEERKESDAAHLPTIQTMAEFAAARVPPVFLIDGIIQKQFSYSLTAPTGSGKTAAGVLISLLVATGQPLHGRETEKARVLYFIGENPDDVRPRFIKQMEEMKLDPAKVDVVFVEGTYKLETDEIRNQITAEVERVGPVGLVIVDTSSSYFFGDDENGNTQMIAHARMLRSLTRLPGHPAVIALCHPKKNGDDTVPRGGGAFMNEGDGNMYLERNGVVMTLHRHEKKFRGDMWEPMSFRLVSGTSDKLLDSRGRHVSTVTAKPISDSEKTSLDDTMDRRRDELLALMKARPGLSLDGMARELGWEMGEGKPYRSLVDRILRGLATKPKPPVEQDKDGHWKLTTMGRKAAGEWRGPDQGEMNID